MRKDESEITVDNPRCDHVTFTPVMVVVVLHQPLACNFGCVSDKMEVYY